MTLNASTRINSLILYLTVIDVADRSFANAQDDKKLSPQVTDEVLYEKNNRILNSRSL